MARRIDFSGADTYIKELNKLSQNSLKVVNKAVYEGAGVVADTCKAKINAADEDTEEQAIRAWSQFTKDGKIHKYRLSKKQKQGLIKGLGLARFENEKGYINTKLGFNGYNDVKTKKYPKGQPNAMIMRTLESGTSAIQKQPLVRKSVSEAKGKAIKKMQETLDKEIDKLMR